MISEKYRLFGIIITEDNEYISIDEEYDSVVDAKNRYMHLKKTYFNIRNIMVYKTEIKLVTYEFSVCTEIID